MRIKDLLQSEKYKETVDAGIMAIIIEVLQTIGLALRVLNAWLKKKQHVLEINYA